MAAGDLPARECREPRGYPVLPEVRVQCVGQGQGLLQGAHPHYSSQDGQDHPIESAFMGTSAVHPIVGYEL